MWNPGEAGVTAFALQSPAAPMLLFVAGALSSIGPCSAPRMLAISSIASEPYARTARCLSFVAGMLLAYAAFAAVGGLMIATMQFSSWIYAGIAVAMMFSGVRTIFRGGSHGRCAYRKATTEPGSALFAGLTTALVVSPCCAPVLTGIVAYASAAHNAYFAAACIVAFGLGHALPVFGVGLCGLFVHRLAGELRLRNAFSTVGAALLIALAAYYLVLA